MKFNIELAELNRVLSRVIGVVEKRTTIPILSNIKIESGPNGVLFTATDLDITFSDVGAADIVAGGVTTIPATVYDFAKKMEKGTVSFEISDGKATIRCGRSKFSVPVIEAADFPLTTKIDGAPTFKITGSELADMLVSTVFCASDDKARYYLNGVYLHGGENLTAVATDGHKLARAVIDGLSVNFPGVIIPRKTVTEIIKMCDGAANVDVWISDTKICIASGNAMIVSKLIDGTFPDYGRIIPSSKNATVTVDGKAFAQAVDRVSMVYSEKTKGVKVAFGRSEAIITAGGGDNGSAEEAVDLDLDGETMDVGFNSRYICDVAAKCGGGKLSIDLVDAGSPAVFRPSDDGGKLYLVMPMRC